MAGLVAAAAIVAGGRLLLFGGDSGGGGAFYSQITADLADPVTTEPDEAWTWRPDDSDTAVVDFEEVDGNYLASGYTANGPELTSLTADGDVAWTADLRNGADLRQISDGLLLAAGEEGGMDVVSPGDGEVLWSDRNGGPIGELDGDILVYEHDTLALRDARTGKEIWHFNQPDGVGLGDDALFTVDGTEVSRIDAATGSATWTVDTEMSGEDAYLSTIVMRDSVIVTDSATEVTALAAGDGKELWRDDLPTVAYGYGGLATPDLAYVYLSGDSEAGEDGSVRFYGKAGFVSDISISADASFSATGWVDDGKAYFRDDADGLIYDETLKVLGRAAGTTAPVHGGYYRFDNGEVSYYEIDSSTAEWERQVASTDDYAEMRPVEKGLVVFSDSTVTLLE